MPYFICFKKTDGESVIRSASDTLRLHEAVDQATKGEYILGDYVEVYQTRVKTSINMRERIPYNEYGRIHS